MAAVVAVAAAAVCYLLFVRTSVGQRLDDAAYLGSRLSNPATKTADQTQLQRITANSFAAILIILLGIGLARRRLWLGVGAALAAGIAVVGTDVAKDWILTRPILTISDYPTSLKNTFPSGHTATAVACALALMMVVSPASGGLPQWSPGLTPGSLRPRSRRPDGTGPATPSGERC